MQFNKIIDIATRLFDLADSGSIDKEKLKVRFEEI